MIFFFRQFRRSPTTMILYFSTDHSRYISSRTVKLVVMSTTGKHHSHEKKRKAGNSRLSIAEVRKNLPVYKFKTQICEKVVNNDVVLVMAETGSGKLIKLFSSAFTLQIVDLIVRLFFYFLLLYFRRQINADSTISAGRPVPANIECARSMRDTTPSCRRRYSGKKSRPRAELSVRLRSGLPSSF